MGLPLPLPIRLTWTRSNLEKVKSLHLPVEGLLVPIPIRRSLAEHNELPGPLCGKRINRPTSDSSCSNLLKHAASCVKKKHDQDHTRTLGSLGVTGTGDIDPREVTQKCAIWCAEAARPFSALEDNSLKSILHPTVLKNLPNRRMVSKAIHVFYTVVQEAFKLELKSHTGALYLGLDAWQSPNGFDILGIVVYWLNERAGLQSMPLDFIKLSRSHTGKYLAETVQLVVEKFGIASKIYGIVSDNASNNEVMVNELKNLKWPHFKGQPQWIRCFAHILNLIAKAILRPFGPQKRNQKETSDLADRSESDSETESSDCEEQIALYTKGSEVVISDSEDNDLGDSDGITKEADSEELDTNDIQQLSDEDEDVDKYTSSSCRQTLTKFRAIARKLKKSPNSKATFIKLCIEKKCDKPHTIERDVCTRWNSTLIQLNSIIRCHSAIIEWQKDKKYGLARKYQINERDIKLAIDLAAILQPLLEITLQVSLAGSPRLSHVVVFIDQITEHLSTIIAQESYAPVLRNACRGGLQLTNKYYTLTDCSPLYRVAMILHPSFKDEYFKIAGWDQKWIDDAISHTREMWINHYKPKPIPTASKSVDPKSKHPTGFLSQLGAASAARSGNSSTDPLDIWLSGALVLDGSDPIDALEWWLQQKRGGNTYGGLLTMALDVLSCPVF
ncbi:uncharacterized protein PGTG_09776 [Puccinia graminis f. sp. tritici CRL 75-36-700-3]|uniref:DUF659 domain-containing protein n=1 Tax=Puccinia graminis f. sp. tritici (strain CRL 75-36-700-3 / race SCCL) TaxID=418459 RepID=E3KID8_PUCGT|nr:uncharacterized protein PGTG_09776 [Puccinia graminis f. sp. tritici CRL 75-36-700-3]EFP84063.2 hypothetical protein PGTG_09776 [Puccinia graminis f. sp. tritici CRL 75-36-700-3]